MFSESVSVTTLAVSLFIIITLATGITISLFIYQVKYRVKKTAESHVGDTFPETPKIVLTVKYRLFSMRKQTCYYFEIKNCPFPMYILLQLLFYQL